MLVVGVVCIILNMGTHFYPFYKYEHLNFLAPLKIYKNFSLGYDSKNDQIKTAELVSHIFQSI